MTTQPLRPPLPPHLQPSAKSASTAKSSQLSAVANATPVGSRSSSKSRFLKEKDRQNAANNDATSEKATLALIRRVLAPDTGHGTDARASPRPVEDVLPPLTSSNEVDTQLYAIIAIIIKEFVNVWYSKITPDHVFVEEVVHIIAHCSRALEQRLRQNDIVEIALDEIPALIQQHVLLYKTAYEGHATSDYGLQPLRIYHILNPHPALSPVANTDANEPSPEQVQNEAMYRQLLVQGALAILLPTEDLENASLRTLVGDIIADLILGQAVSGKVCEGWFLQEAITKVVEIIKARIEPKETGEELHQGTRSKLEQFGLLSAKTSAQPDHSSKRRQWRAGALFWRTMQWIYLGSLLIRYIIVGMFQSRRLPGRFQHSKASALSPIGSTLTETTTPPCSSLTENVPSPVLTYRISDFISTILDLSTRMPWLISTLAFGQNILTSGAGRLGSINSTFDKFLYSTIQTHVLPPSLLPIVLANLRASIFPNNTMGSPAPPTPSPEERTAIRRRAAESILSLIPPLIARIFFTVDHDTMEEAATQECLEQLEDILDVFGNKEMNKHLIYGIVELVLVRLMPELTVKTPGELLVDRIGVEEKLQEKVWIGDWEEDSESGDARMEAMKYFGDTV